MQKSRAIDLRVPQRTPASGLVRLPRSEARQEQPVLHPTGDGGYLIAEKPFTTFIAPDGTISFEDSSAFGFARDGHRSGRAEERAEALGQGALRDTTIVGGSSVIGITMKLELNDMIIRAVGDDPYAARKRKVAKLTAPLRQRLAEQACRDRLKQSFVQLKYRLRRIWNDSTRSVADRRARLFSVWDGCLEEGDVDRVLHGKMVRASVVAFVQANLPRGSERAFTAAELLVLNEQRQSKTKFEPYL